ncbi:hypothetical protein [Tenacibaculum sp. IB213877]|uniref:hypothetical protein n=1 Tax=Tenacibaculum sp. IB213877 TaxID=3097351 RepID=UPI002A5AFB95|nr:hypothetical protein [Tenacibaculum sp. IB213877]MDY0779927.1 hypothetical protein [Tenacibaculum sp. IB213877]
MKKVLFFLVFVLFTVFIQAQSLKDSVNVLYKNYFELLKDAKKLDTIVLKVNNFEELMASNNKKIQDLTDAELFGLQKQLEQRRKKIISTTEFVFAANSSLNAIKQLDATSDYLNQISSLNNPDNTDLGFSLSEEITTILQQKIIKGNKKINGVKSSKFLLFVDNIIKSPITQSITNAIPVVSSIKSVVDLVIGNALKGKDVTINDVVEFKKSLQVYLKHYEALARAQLEFEQNLGNLDVRKEGLVLLLTQYTTERIHTLNPSVANISQKQSLTQLINSFYTKENIQQQVDAIISLQPSNYNQHLLNNKLAYPTYALNQAKFIRDEVEALSKEYVSIFTAYQVSLQKVLNDSKSIGDATKIDNKSHELERKLNEVKTAFNDNLNMYKLNVTFKNLMAY